MIKKNGRFENISICLILQFLLILSNAYSQKYVQGKEYDVWSKLDSPFIVQGNILVAQGDELIIEPGVVVAFEDNFSFIIEGRFIAQGGNSDDSLIVFTSLSDDEYIDERYRRGRNLPYKGEWQGLVFDSAMVTKSILENVIIRFCSDPIKGVDSDICLKDITIEETENTVIHLNDSTYQIQEYVPFSPDSLTCSILKETPPPLPGLFKRIGRFIWKIKYYVAPVLAYGVYVLIKGFDSGGGDDDLPGPPGLPDN